MSTWWKSARCFAPIIFSVALFTAAAAAAEPVRITVNFSVSGDNIASDAHPAVDPLFGTATASGFFSLVSNIPAGGGIVENFTSGLKADALSLNFGETSWTTSNADVGRLIFDSQGVLTLWQLAGFPA